MDYTYISFKIEARKREPKIMTDEKLEFYKGYVKGLNKKDLLSVYKQDVSDYAINNYEASKREDDTKSAYEYQAEFFKKLVEIDEEELLSR